MKGCIASTDNDKTRIRKHYTYGKSTILCRIEHDDAGKSRKKIDQMHMKSPGKISTK